MLFTFAKRYTYNTGLNLNKEYNVVTQMLFLGPNAIKHKVQIYLKYESYLGWPYSLPSNLPDKKVKFDSLYLPFKAELINYLKAWTEVGKSLHKKDNLNTSYMTSFLFYGEPGTGKSSIIDAIIELLHFCRVDIDFNKPLTQQFENILPGSVVVMEELDCVMGTRDKNGKVVMTEENMKNLRELLVLLDGKKIVYKDVVFVATTNYLDNLDVALKRSGRFNYKYECVRLDKEGVASVCKSYNFDPKPFLDNYVKPILPADLVTFLEEQTIYRIKKRYDLYQEFKEYRSANKDKGEK